MTIIIKNKDTLLFDHFKFKCCVGKNGFSKNKREGDKKTPVGNFFLGPLFYRDDKNKKPKKKIKLIKIKKKMGWCNDINHQKYNKLIRINKHIKYEEMFRRDNKYDFVIPIKYNFKKPIKNKGSAIFIHLTENYKKTLGCIALKKKDFLILLKIINKKTKIRIL